MRETEHYA